MPDESADPCPPDAENNTPEAPAPRPGPLQHSDKADAGCLIALGAVFVMVFLLPAAFLLGGAPVIIPLVACFLLILAVPFINPLERKGGAAKWWGRGITFLLLAGAVAAACIWFLNSGKMMSEEY
jgi:hypothetical protein